MNQMGGDEITPRVSSPIPTSPIFSSNDGKGSRKSPSLRPQTVPSLHQRPRDKVMRTNAVADMFSSGSIWAPLRYRWVQELVEEMAAFPYGESDDAHDAEIWGLTRIRRGGFRIPTDELEEEYVALPAREY